MATDNELLTSQVCVIVARYRHGSGFKGPEGSKKSVIWTGAISRLTLDSTTPADLHSMPSPSWLLIAVCVLLIIAPQGAFAFGAGNIPR